VTLDAAYTSFMARPKETAEIILKHHPDLTLHSVEDFRKSATGNGKAAYEAEIEANYPGMLSSGK
jgi:broad specificity phosphatase PhoE